MKIQQLSLFVENSPGRLSQACKVLAASGINIVTLSLADTQQYGILRLIVKDWQKAKNALEKGGYVVTITEVVAVEVSDRPGGLAELLDVLDQGRVNIEYMYAFTVRTEDAAVMIFRFEDPDGAIKVLQSAGKDVVEGVDLFAKCRS
ncbi:MAG TPA: amino acid-binding protein [Planctomycetota bacterium]|jgi:hypothetical protein